MNVLLQSDAAAKAKKFLVGDDGPVAEASDGDPADPKVDDAAAKPATEDASSNRDVASSEPESETKSDPSTVQTGAATQESPGLLRNIEDIDFGSIAIVITVAYLIIWLTRTLLPRLAATLPSRFRLYPLAVIPIARLVVLTLAIGLTSRLIFRVTFENFLVIAGAASVAIGFAFKDYVSSLIAGIIAVFERPYRPGDWVKIGDHYGEVRSVGMRSLAIQTPSDDRITVPHSHLWSDNIANSNDGTRTLMCVVDFYVHPDHDARRLRAMLTDVGRTSAYLNYDQPIVVMLSETPVGTHYKVKLYPFDLRDQFALISDVTVRGKEAIRQCGASFVTGYVASQP